MANLSQSISADADSGQGALAAAYDAHAPRLFAVARRLFQVSADAEECVQEVFVKLVERENSLSEIEDLPAYLFASLRHAAGARAKHKARQAALHLKVVPANEPSMAGPDDNRSRELGRAILLLPIDQREVVSLKVDGELTFAEIAKVLGISLNTAASRYRYALAKLKDALAESGADQ